MEKRGGESDDKKDKKKKKSETYMGSNMQTPQRSENREKKRDNELCGSWLKMIKKGRDG